MNTFKRLEKLLISEKITTKEYLEMANKYRERIFKLYVMGHIDEDELQRYLNKK